MAVATSKLTWSQWRQSAMVYGFFGTAVRVGANIFLIPLVVSRLSSLELSLWWVFIALGAFANLADFGFGPVISRVYSFLWAGAEDFDAEGLRPPPVQGTPNLRRIRELNATVRHLYVRLAVGATIVVGLGGMFLIMKPARLIGQPSQVWSAWAVYLVTIGFSLGTSHWMLACQGINRVRDVQATYLWSGLTYVATASLLLVTGFGLFSLVIATFVRAAVTQELFRRVYRVAVPDGLENARPDSAMLKTLWPNACKFGLLSIGAYLLANGNVLISSHFLSPSVTAAFGLTAQIGNFLMSFAGLWLAVKWPQITILRTQGRLEQMAVMFAHRLAWTVGTFIALAIMVILLGNQLLEWKGTQTRLLSIPCLVVYLAYLAQQLFYVQFGSLAHTENVVPFFKIGLFTGIGMFCLSWIMTARFGLWGLLLAPLIAESVYSSWFTVRRGFQGQPLRPRQFLRAAVFGRL